MVIKCIIVFMEIQALKRVSPCKNNSEGKKGEEKKEGQFVMKKEILGKKNNCTELKDTRSLDVRFLRRKNITEQCLCGLLLEDVSSYRLNSAAVFMAAIATRDINTLCLIQERYSTCFGNCSVLSATLLLKSCIQ